MNKLFLLATVAVLVFFGGRTMAMDEGLETEQGGIASEYESLDSEQNISEAKKPVEAKKKKHKKAKKKYKKAKKKKHKKAKKRKHKKN